MGNIHKNRAKLIPGLMFIFSGTLTLVLGVSKGLIPPLVFGPILISVGGVIC